MHHEQSLMEAAGGGPAGEGVTPAIPTEKGSLDPLATAAGDLTPVAAVPSLPPAEQQARRSTAEPAPSLCARAAASHAGPPAESPLASLATAALPSFSPDKTQQPWVPAAGEAATPAAPPAAAAAPCGPGASWRALPGSPPAAGARSSSAALQAHPAATHWAASLRPPGEQLLPGLPNWDRSRSGSPGACGSQGSSSLPASPCRSGGRSCSLSRTGGMPGSPARQRPRTKEAKQRQLQGEEATPLSAPPQRCPAPAQQQPQQPQQASPGCGPGPLTSMVVRAVSKLQQLHELEAELELPAGAGFGQALPRGPLLGGPAAHQPSLRRSLEPALGAIREAGSDDERGSGGTGSGGLRRREPSPGRGAQLGRLQRLQQQLDENMHEVRDRGSGRTLPCVTGCPNGPG